MAAAQGPGNDMPADNVGGQGDARGHRNYVRAWVVGLVLLGLAIWGVAHIANGLNTSSGTNLSNTQTGPAPGSAEAGRSGAAGGGTTVRTTGGGAPSAGSGAPTATAGDPMSGGASGGSASSQGVGKP